MKGIQKQIEEIWNLALEHQDFRDDKGHAKTTLAFARELLASEPADPNVVIPAIILHDIGWSELPERERFLPFRQDVPPEQKREVRLKHQNEGAKLASGILDKVDYDKGWSEHILEIISQHDTREGIFSPEDAVVRDADKLWRFSGIGFWADVRRIGIPAPEQYNKLKNSINQDKFFFTKSARIIARNELVRRKEEIGC